MARFSTAAKALRGPFKKLVRQLELTMRKLVVKKLGPVGWKVAGRLATRDSETAFEAARKAARDRLAGARPVPVATSAAVDRTTGRVVGIGHARDNPEVPAELSGLLPKESLERWPVSNCAEVSAAATAVRNGSRFEDLVIRTVKTKQDVSFPPCKNCKTWLPGED